MDKTTDPNSDNKTKTSSISKELPWVEPKPKPIISQKGNLTLTFTLTSTSATSFS